MRKSFGDSMVSLFCIGILGTGLLLTSCSQSSDPDKDPGLEALAPLIHRDVLSIAATGSDAYTQATAVGGGFMHNISAFRIGTYEVTYELWFTVRQWALANGYSFANPGSEGSSGTVGADPTALKLEPVTRINWRDCMVWCNAYSQMSGLVPVYYGDAGYTAVLKDSTDGSYASSLNTTAGSFDAPFVNPAAKGYRLPTEGEWQYAASCGGMYPWNYASGADADWDAHIGGADIDGDGIVRYSADVSWNVDSSFPGGVKKTQETGSLAANKWGLFDMSGNACEWCFDWDGALPSSVQNNYTGSGSGESRIIKGAAYNTALRDQIQVGARQVRAYNGPFGEGMGTGFRIARSQ